MVRLIRLVICFLGLPESVEKTVYPLRHIELSRDMLK